MSSGEQLSYVQKTESLAAQLSQAVFWCEKSPLFLYTSWHVVTGIELRHPVLPGTLAPARRMALKVSMQANERRDDLVVAIGGMSSFTVNLYDRSNSPPLPLWEQDEASVPNSALSSANLAQPFWHDVARIRLPDDVKPTEWQVLSPNGIWPHLISPGDPLLVVGYPYGYSVVDDSPTPIVLTRHVAAARIGPPHEVLIDGGGAPGMSGGPVFCESQGRLFLFGLYTGVIFPDGAPYVDKPERTTALGVVCPLNLLRHTKFRGVRP